MNPKDEYSEKIDTSTTEILNKILKDSEETFKLKKKEIVFQKETITSISQSEINNEKDLLNGLGLFYFIIFLMILFFGSLFIN
ncbi:MAG: hypothetical protein WCT07_00565 [Candidatus Paceibacterota bacterium]|jgi:hypothetical protein